MNVINTKIETLEATKALIKKHYTASIAASKKQQCWLIYQTNNPTIINLDKLINHYKNKVMSNKEVQIADDKKVIFYGNLKDVILSFFKPTSIDMSTKKDLIYDAIKNDDLRGVKPPKYYLWKSDKSNNYHWHCKAGNGEIIFSGEPNGYASEQMALQAIDRAKRYAKHGEIINQTSGRNEQAN